MVTIIEIAKLSNCSVSTVSKALNNYPDVSEKTRKRIMKIASDAGYIPNATAQSLVRKKSNTIGVVYEVERGLKNLFFSEVLDAFRATIEQKGYDILLLSNKSNRGLDYVDHSRFKQVDGVLIVAGGRNVDAIGRMKENHLPVLTLDPPLELKNAIYSNSYEGIKKSCSYLYQLGHRRIAFIQGDPETLIGAQRYQAYSDFIAEKGLKPLLAEGRWNTYYSMEEGYQTMQAIFERHGLPEAVCASSDLMALGAMRYLRSNGFSIPDDISIIGFDNLQFCDIVEPRLTTVKQDYKYIGTMAGETLLDMIENKTLDFEPILVETSIVVRDSCKKRH
jgi:LacI family transcriptional regulator